MLLVLVLGLAALFYLLIPGLGALYVRRRWLNFRRSLMQSSMFPRATYADLRGGQTESACFRFFGTLEAIEGNYTLWLADGQVSVAVDMTGTDLYILPKDPEGTPIRRNWATLGGLTEGSRFYTAGRLERRDGQGIFRHSREMPLIIIMYEGDAREILPRAVTQSIQKNEYWNVLTPASLAAGFISLLLVAYLAIRVPAWRSAGILSLALALLPNTFFVPPGILFFYLFNHLWKKARIWRSLKYRLALPFRWFRAVPQTSEVLDIVHLPDGQPYTCADLSRQDLTLLPGSSPLNTLDPDDEEATKPAPAWAFGAWDEQRRTLGQPNDPMGDFVTYPANPWKAFQEAKKKARTGEILAMVCFGIGVFSNLVLLVFLLRLWVR